ncbi:MAG: response regulator transcription factor [Candidatus Pacearchaeota archaeon]
MDIFLLISIAMYLYMLPKKNGLEVLLVIKKINPNQKCILISSVEEQRLKTICQEAGIQGYIFKSESRKKIAEAIQNVLNGETYYSEVKNPTLALWEHPSNPFLKLSHKELEILKEMLNMRNMKDTADDLAISVKTVDTHRMNIKRKLKMDNEELMLEAKKWGLI